MHNLENVTFCLINQDNTSQNVKLNFSDIVPSASLEALKEGKVYFTLLFWTLLISAEMALYGRGHMKSKNQD